VGAVLLVVYVVGVALLATAYPSTRFADPVPIGPDMYMSGTDKMYHGRLVVVGWPIPFYLARTEPPEPNTQSPQITVARRFSPTALVANVAAVFAVAGIIVAGQYLLSGKEGFRAGWLLICVAVLVGVGVMTRVRFLDRIPIYEQQDGEPSGTVQRGSNET
jgi:type IV secretory pathway VirB2 component (pilin)